MSYLTFKHTLIRGRNLVSFNPSLQGTSTNFKRGLWTPGRLDQIRNSREAIVLFPLPNLRLNPTCRNLSILLLQPKSMAQTFPHFHQKSITNQGLCKSSQPSICSPRCWCLTFCKFCTSAISPYPMAAMPSMDLEP